MFIQVHNYYAQRFEPGVLFPDTISTTMLGVLEGDTNFRPLITSEIDQNIDINGIQVSLSVFQEAEATLNQDTSLFYGYIGLYFFGAPEDFNLNEMLGYKSNIATYDANNITVNVTPEQYLDGRLLDSRITLVGEGESQFSTSPAVREIFYSDVASMEITVSPITVVLMEASTSEFNFSLT